MFQPLAEEDLPDDLRVLLTLWRARAGGRRFPPPEAFTADTLQPWFDRLHLVELLDDGDLFFRLFAGKSRALLGYDMTGRRVSELSLNERAMTSARAYRRCLTLGRPMFDCVPARVDDNRAHPAYDRLLLPLGSTARANMLIVCLAFRDLAGR